MFIVLVSHSNKTLHQVHKLVDKPCVDKVYLITIITPVSTVWNAATKYMTCGLFFAEEFTHYLLPKPEYWIGLTDLKDENIFKWDVGCKNAVNNVRQHRNYSKYMSNLFAIRNKLALVS